MNEALAVLVCLPLPARAVADCPAERASALGTGRLPHVMAETRVASQPSASPRAVAPHITKSKQATRQAPPRQQLPMPPRRFGLDQKSALLRLGFIRRLVRAKGMTRAAWRPQLMPDAPLALHHAALLTNVRLVRKGGCTGSNWADARATTSPTARPTIALDE